MCMYLILGKPLKVRPTTICIEVVLLTMPRTCWSTQITLKYHLEFEGLQKFLYNVLTLDLATLNWVTQYNLQQPHPYYSHLFQTPVTLRLYTSYIFNTATSLSHPFLGQEIMTYRGISFCSFSLLHVSKEKQNIIHCIAGNIGEN